MPPETRETPAQMAERLEALANETFPEGDPFNPEEECRALRAGAAALRAQAQKRPGPLTILDGRIACPKCGEKADLIAAACDAEAPRDVWECPVCKHQFTEAV